ncbi:hypothetical protein ACDA63_01255 [Uliginosibacterium sp. sgz301328]|uniref:hypothetical protein n=1 Tax=Uliginosibacterium sp. sgz301328 TaxID=3243764 RepID=UPI00359E93E2
MTKTSSKFLAACVVLAMFGSAQAADNLSKGARADGSSKGEGSSYGAVIDGDAATAWTPAGDAGESVCVKWDSSKTVGAVVIKEIGDNVTAWRVEDRNGSKVKALAEGTTLGSAATAEFEPLSSKKICVVVVSAKGKPAIAELETYASKP